MSHAIIRITYKGELQPVFTAATDEDDLNAKLTTAKAAVNADLIEVFRPSLRVAKVLSWEETEL